MKAFFYSLSTFFLMVPFSLFGQGTTSKIEPEPGFAVSVKGDTLFGNINYLKKTGYRQSMQVKLPDQSTKSINARNYVLVKVGNEIFESFLVPGGEEKQFFWQKEGGKIFFYEYQYELYQLNTMVTKTEYYVRRKGSDELLKTGSGNFKKKLGEWMSDAPDLVKKLDDKETKFDDLEAIINEYNKK